MSCKTCYTQNNIKTPSSHQCQSYGSCNSAGCSKKSVFDWLGNMALPANHKPFDIFEIRFKNGRKGFFRNVNNIKLSMGDVVAVEGNPGHDIGTVSLSGELVKLQLNKKHISSDDEGIKNIYRKSTDIDINTWQKAKSKEAYTQKESRIIIDKLGLKMKLSDVEYQGDGKKATFYYTAESRIDFRQLIKDLASKFNIRIEMKQVDYRHEAARLGGIGSCGRELCCSTWLNDFKKVHTSSARYQQLSLSPQKLQGQCGRLKCCLNFELDTYLDTLKDFPDNNTLLQTEQGAAKFIKMDIFKGLMWYAYDNSNDYKWYTLTAEQVHEIINLNKKGEKALSLSELEIEEDTTDNNNFDSVLHEDSLTRFDQPKRNRKKSRHKIRSKGTLSDKTPVNKDNSKTTKKNQGKKKPNNSESCSRPIKKENNKEQNNASKNKQRKPNNKRYKSEKTKNGSQS